MIVVMKPHSTEAMIQNMVQRVEVAFPIENRLLKSRLINECFTIPWHTEMIAWDMQTDGSYIMQPSEDVAKPKHPQKRLLKKIRA